MCKRTFKGTGFFSDAGLLRKCIRVNANREGACLEPAAIYLAQNAADGQPRIGVDDAITKIIGVKLSLETDKIIGSEAAKEPLVVRQSARHFWRRPWDMQEKTNPVGAS